MVSKEVKGSSSAKPKTARSEKRRELLLETTLRLVAEGGVDSVTHRRVAEAAAVPLGSTTYYFTSRRHLLREAFAHYLEQTTRLQKELAPRLEGAVADDIVELLVEFTEREFADADMLRAEYELTLFASRDAEVAELLHRWDEWMVASLARSLEALGASRSFDGARTLLDLLRGYELDRLTRKELDSAGLRRRLTAVVDAFLPRD